MPKKYKYIVDHPLYLDSVKIFHANPLLWAVIGCGKLPSFDQEELLLAISPPDAKVSVVSGTTTGKTAAFAMISLWHFFWCPFGVVDGKLQTGSNTYIAAPRLKQVSEGVWKELNDLRMAISNGPFAWLNTYYVINKQRVEMNGFGSQWFISQAAMQQGQSVGVAGKHRYWQLIILDEAAGIPDEHFDVVVGTQSEPGNRILAASQGVKNTGRFYDTHHGLNKKNGGSWHCLTFNSEHSPFPTTKWLSDREIECGGKNSVEYRVRVLGKFADASGSNLLVREDIEKCFSRGRIIGDDEPYGLFVLADVALGGHRDYSVALVAKVIGYGDSHDANPRRVEYIALPYYINSKDEITFAGDLVELIGSLSNATLLVDGDGAGGTVCKLITQSGVPVRAVHWGKPCFKSSYKIRFINRRACAMVRLRDAMRDGRVSFLYDCDKQVKEKIISQGTRLPYSFVERGGLKYRMMPKEEMREEGISSPDVFDTKGFVFLEDADDYVVAENNYLGQSENIIQSLMTEADDFFADMA